ncbi:MAG TPA: hypothetical protein VM287_06635 [Egibacteraceae bacterium]|nr:hypothetical protein [Egibacteraceae bacterium]
MSDPPPSPPPFGAPTGPRLSTPELVAHYLDGATTGASPDAEVSGELLTADEHAVAVRLDGAVLVRLHLPGVQHLPPEVLAVRQHLEEALSAFGMVLTDEDSVLGGIVGIEVAGLRGEAWSLWAHDPEQGQAALARRALGEVADVSGLLDADRARRQEEAEVQATLAELEREL